MLLACSRRPCQKWFFFSCDFHQIVLMIRSFVRMCEWYHSLFWFPPSSSMRTRRRCRSFFLILSFFFFFSAWRQSSCVSHWVELIGAPFSHALRAPEKELRIVGTAGGLQQGVTPFLWELSLESSCELKEKLCQSLSCVNPTNFESRLWRTPGQPIGFSENKIGWQNRFFQIDLTALEYVVCNARILPNEKKREPPKNDQVRNKRRVSWQNYPLEA